MAGQKMRGDGWEQIEAGLGLIHLSGLASWDRQRFTLVAANRNDFESHVSGIHGEFGRLICWITFSAGTEYIVRGAFAVKGHCPLSQEPSIRPPNEDEEIKHWIKVAKGGVKRCGDPSFLESNTKEDLKFGGSLPWNKILGPGPDQDLVSTSIGLLAKKLVIATRTDIQRTCEALTSM